MSELCQFALPNNDCLIRREIVEINGACKEIRGENCGPAAAYGMLLWQLGGLEHFDFNSPIMGTYKIQSDPGGDPPLEIREQLVGIELPVRQLDSSQAGLVEVNLVDIILSLVRDGKLAAAAWYAGPYLKPDHLKDRRVFKSSGGMVTERQSISSLDYYGSRLEPSVRTAIDAQTQAW